MNLLTLLYQFITLVLLVLIILNLFETKDKHEKALAAMLIATFLLRVILVK
jgi:hypothetical protein